MILDQNLEMKSWENRVQTHRPKFYFNRS